MKRESQDLYQANSDIILLLVVSREIAWNNIRENSVHRLMYLTSVLYSFMNIDKDSPFSNYHFSITLSGPYSSLIDNSITNLKTREIINEVEEGIILNTNNISGLYSASEDKREWYQTVVFLLGLYGESKIFGFVIQDPEYKDVFQKNSLKELNILSGNETVKVLNQFKKAFEESIDDVSNISHKEYLELYFEYVFSRIIKKEN